MVIQSVPSGQEGLIPTLDKREPSLVKATTTRSHDPTFLSRDSQLTVRDSIAKGCRRKICKKIILTSFNMFITANLMFLDNAKNSNPSRKYCLPTGSCQFTVHTINVIFYQ
jgi:hypothetical protein